jgi:hypothetical protein
VSRPTALGRVSRGPSALDPRTPGRAVAGCGQRPLPPPRPPGGCRGGQASRVHALSRRVATGEGPACGHRGDRHRARPTAQGLERCDPRRSTPGGAVCLACLCEPLQPCRGLVDGADRGLADAVRRWGRADHVRAPPAGGRVPGSWAGRAAVVPQHTGLQTPWCRFEIPERICTSPAQSAPGCVCSLGDRDRCEVARAPQARQRECSAAVRFAPLPGLLREQSRRDAPAGIACCGQIALEPRATRTRCIDQDEALGLRWQWPHQCLKGTRACADGAEREDSGTRGFGGLGHRDGCFLDIPSTIKRARLCHG